MQQQSDDGAMIEPTKEQLGRGLTASFVRDIVVSGVLPWVAVFVLQSFFHVSIVRALLIAMIFPLADGAFSLVKRRRLDAVGSVNLGFLIASLIATFFSGDIHFVLLKGAVITGIFSLVCLGSLLAPKPLMFYLGGQMQNRGDAVLDAHWNQRWNERPEFRKIMRLITAVWGVGYLLEVVVRVIMAYTLPPVVALATAPAITYGVLAALIVWTIAYTRAMRAKYAAYEARLLASNAPTASA